MLDFEYCENVEGNNLQVIQVFLHQMRIQIFLVSVESFQLFRHDVDIIIVSGHNCPVIAKYRLCGPAETKLGIVTAFSGTFLEFNHNN